MFSKLLGVGSKESEVVSFVGAGGKTTALFALSKELRHRKRLVTTTTAIYEPNPSLWDMMIIRPDLLNDLGGGVIKPDTVTVWGRSLNQENKLLGVDLECLSHVYQKKLFDVILVEADGSKRKPIKAPMDHEPVIPEESSAVVGVIGLSALNKPLNDQWVHRVKEFSNIVGAQPETLIKPEHVRRLVIHPDGLFKGTPLGAEKILVLNQADHNGDKILGKEIVEVLKRSNTSINRFIITSFTSLTCELVWGEGF